MCSSPFLNTSRRLRLRSRGHAYLRSIPTISPARDLHNRGHHVHTPSRKPLLPANAKSDGSSAAPKKKARAQARSKDSHAFAGSIVTSIIASPETFDLPEGDDDVRQTLVSLATYAKTLEPVEKSSSQIAAEVGRLRRTAVSGIKKQMSVSLNASPFSGYALYHTLSYFDTLY